MRRTLVMTGTVLAIALVVPGLGFQAAADPITVGDCQPSGMCASVCIEDVASCPRQEDFACVGISLQVPQCLKDPWVPAIDVRPVPPAGGHDVSPVEIGG